MKRLLLAFLSSTALVLLLAGCSTSSRPLMGLGLELVALRRAADGSTSAEIRVTNPNVVAYNFARSTHRIYLEDRLLGTVTIEQPTGVPPQMSISQQGTVALDKNARLSAGPARYRLESVLVLRLYGDNTQPNKLSGSGTVDVTTQ